MPERPKPHQLLMLRPGWAMNKNGNLLRISAKGEQYRDKTDDLWKRKEVPGQDVIEAGWAKLGLLHRKFPDKPKPSLRREVRRLSDPDVVVDVSASVAALSLKQEQEREQERDEDEAKERPRRKTSTKAKALRQPDLGEFEPPERWVDFIAKHQHKLSVEKQERRQHLQDMDYACECTPGCAAPPVPVHMRDPTAALLDDADAAEYDGDRASRATKAYSSLVRCHRWRQWMRDGDSAEFSQVQDLAHHFVDLKRGRGLADLYLDDALAGSAFRDPRTGTVRVLATAEAAEAIRDAMDEAGVKARITKAKSATQTGVAGLTLAHGLVTQARKQAALGLCRVREFSDALEHVSGPGSQAQLRYVL